MSPHVHVALTYRDDEPPRKRAARAKPSPVRSEAVPASAKSWRRRRLRLRIRHA
jgi:hypothetical protein